MAPEPTGILQTAIRQVPSVRYALGIAGIAAAGSLVTKFLGYDRASIIIIGGTFVGMILLYVFSRMVASQSEATTIHGIVLLYAMIFFFCCFLFFTVTAFSFTWPLPWAIFIGAASTPSPPPPDERALVIQRMQNRPDDLAKCLHVLDTKTQSTYDGKVFKDLGDFYSENTCIQPDPEKAIGYYNRAVASLEWSALIPLADMYSSGQAPGGPDYAKARLYLEQAIQHGESRAYLLIGQMYYLGQGVAKDVQKAISLDLEGAEHGDPRGYTLAGAAYTDNDSGMQPNCGKALPLIQKAYDLGEERAATVLCDYRYHGQCLPQDRTLARKLCQEGKERGDERAAYLLDHWKN